LQHNRFVFAEAFISVTLNQRHFVLRIEDNWVPALYYYQPKDGKDTRSQVCKGCVNLLRSTISNGASDATLVINLDPVSCSLEPNKFKGFAQLVMYRTLSRSL
jgi:hypothetical protein